MAPENKLNISNPAELAKIEEKISKSKAVQLFENNIVEEFEVGKFSVLSKIHKFLFDDLYDFAGKVRTVNIAKGSFRFAPVMYLEPALKHIDDMPQSTFDEIIEKNLEDSKNVRRNRAYFRKVRYKNIRRKKLISKSVYGLDWYKHDGQYSKGKIHCGCGLCKFGKKYGLPTYRDMREKSREKSLVEDYKTEQLNNYL